MMHSCPLKPGVVCAATYELAVSSRCINCPLLDQCDQALLYSLHKRNKSYGCIGVRVSEEAYA
ncbi:MAG TPA: hypothetical protein VJY42_02330 [Candidatus Methanomethylophilaceae archaeon]|nr:hypothetical protein [Candidatus Methanomethylophilaceae archaeon]